MPAEISPYYFGVREARGRKQLDGRFVSRRKDDGAPTEKDGSAFGSVRDEVWIDLISRGIPGGILSERNVAGAKSKRTWTKKART